MAIVLYSLEYFLHLQFIVGHQYISLVRYTPSENTLLLGLKLWNRSQEIGQTLQNLFLLFASCCVSMTNNGTYIQPSTQQSLLITLHVSTLMGHLQVFSTSFTIKLQREMHTFLLTYIGHKRLRSFSFTPYRGY
jgi:hypothetical protein